MHPQRLFILEKILTNALKHPNSEAVKDGNGTFTYSQLVEQAKRISTQIEEQHLCGSVINVDVGRCKERVVVLLGILMSGSFYLPLEEEWPGKRKQVVCNQAHISASAKLTENSTLRIVPQLNDGNRPKKDPVPSGGGYLIFTSGSTGTPKGVVIAASSLDYVLKNSIERFNVSNSTKLLAVASPAFDFSIFELLLPLVAGGTVCIADKSIPKNPDYFEQISKKWQINCFTGTPTMFTMMRMGGWIPQTNATLILGGENVSNLLLKNLSTANQIWNIYGPTETTIYCLSKKLKLGEEITLGKPLPGTKVWVQTKKKNERTGELYVVGPSVGFGYINNIELTKSDFFTDSSTGFQGYRTGDLVSLTSAGEMSFIGRADNQIKIHGYRIETEEVENHINAFLGGHESCVSAIKSESETRLVAFLPKNALQSPIDSIDALRNRLKLVLPNYAIPSNILLLDELPINSNGKINRTLLKNNYLEKVNISNRNNKLAQLRELKKPTMTQFLSNLLDEEIGDDDNLFAHGMNSLKVVQFVSRMRRLGQFLNVRDVYQNPTVNQLKKVIIETDNVFIAPKTCILGRKEFRVLPSQRRFLSHNITASHSFVESVAASVQANTMIDLQVCAEMLVKKFPEISYGLSFKGREQHPHLVKIDEPIMVKTIELSPTDDIQSKIDETLETSASNLNIKNGPIAVLHYFTKRDTHLLVLVIHHWACDALTIHEYESALKELAETKRAGIGISEPVEEIPGFLQYAGFLEDFYNSDKGRKKIEQLPDIKRHDSLSASWYRESNGSNPEILPPLYIRDHSIRLLQERDDGQYGLLDKLSLAALTNAASECLNLDNIVVDVTRNGREQADCPVLPSMTGWISSSVPFFHKHCRFNSVDEELLALNTEYEEMLQQETAWNSFRSNSPHVYPEACPTFFLNVTRSSHKNEASPLSTSLIRGSTYPYSYGYPIEVRIQYFNDEAKVRISYNNAYFSKETIEQFLDFFKEHILLVSHVLANALERE